MFSNYLTSSLAICSLFQFQNSLAAQSAKPAIT